MGTYEPCVLGSDGNCTRWSHDHAADRPTVTDNARAETTTATIEDTARAIHRALAPRWMSVAQALGLGQDDDDYEAMLADIAQAIADAGLLATARTRPTREEVLAVIPEIHAGENVRAWPEDEREMRRRPDWRSLTERNEALYLYRREKVADAVLALYADQPTEAEAGARALEQAAEWLRGDMDEPWGDRAANRLDVRAARIRAGGA